MNDVQLITCTSPEDFEIAKSITSDYIIWLKMDLSFQNIQKEYAVFESMYSQPNGGYIYLKKDNQIIGGVAFRNFETSVCEMKRLFVYPEFHRLGFGKILSLAIIKLAKEQGYKKMRLDTVEKLKAAIKIYKDLGFYDIEPYRENPDPTVKFMELDVESFSF